jgi:hypothetical protein
MASLAHFIKHLFTYIVVPHMRHIVEHLIKHIITSDFFVQNCCRLKDAADYSLLELTAVNFAVITRTQVRGFL